MIPTPERVTVAANGLAHVVYVWPASSALAPRGTVLLFHGFMDAALSFDRLAQRLRGAGYRVLAPDLRGFGQAPRPGAAAYYHFPDYVFDVADIRAALCPEPVHVLGHSMGGTVATLFSGAFPETVRSLISLEGLGPPDNDPAVGPDRMRQWIEQVRAERVRSAAKDMTPDEAFSRLRMNHARVPEPVLREVIQHLVRPGDAPGSVQWCFDPLHRTRAPMPFQAVLLKAFMGRVAAPVLFVDGGPTGFHPPDEDERLASFSSLRKVTLDGAGHMMHWTQPDELANVVLSFLGELDA